MIKKQFAMFARLVNFIGFPIKVFLIRNSKRVRVLILAEDSVLLVRSSIGSQLWSLPGGGIEQGESGASAAIREAKEETGIALDRYAPIDLGEIIRPIKRTNQHFYAQFYVIRLPKITPPTIIRPLEILEVQWFKLSDLPKNRSDTLDVGLSLLQDTQA